MSATENVGTFEHHIEDRAGILADPTLPEQGTSTLSAFQRKRRELEQEETREVRKSVPLWKGALRIVYRYPEDGADRIVVAMERALEAAQREKKTGKREQGTLNANADVLIACVHDIEFCDDGVWGQLDDDGPSSFNHKLAAKLDLEIPERVKSPARFVLRHLFSPKAAVEGKFEGDLSMLDQGGEVLQWLKGEDERIDEELRGE